MRAHHASPACLIALFLASPAPAEELTYPETRRVEHVDLYHGVEVRDPYRWLEADIRESQEVRDWIEEQSDLTRSYLEAIPERDRILSRITRLRDYEKYGPPFKAGGRYYYLKNDGLQPFYVLYRMDSLEDEPRALLDPNTWSRDASVALDGYAFSDDGRYVAYGISEGGSDWRTWRVKEIESGRLLDEQLRWIKYTGVSWTADSKGFFYGRFEPPTEGEELQGLNLNQKLYYHQVGTEQSEDVLVYERPDQPGWVFATEVTEDGRYLVLTAMKSAERRFRILFQDLSKADRGPIHLVGDFDHDYTFVGNDESVFYFLTDVEAPRRRVVAIDTNEPARDQWREIVAQSDDTLEAVSLVGDFFIARYLHDAKTLVKLFSTDGELIRDVELPAVGTAFGFEGRRSDSETFYYFSNFSTPASIYRYELGAGKGTRLRQAKTDFEPSDFEVGQVFYRSKDGTRVPMFIAHKKGLELDGDNPALLYGYGGFGTSLGPSFQASRLAWMEMGGVFALAGIRGGGEYGEAWHRAGMKLNKQRVFDDFIAGAEYLIEAGYTRPKKLAIQGRSGGGLLVGAVMTQRPDLFGACLAEFGVMDMLRFHEFTAGRFWVDELGSSDDPEEFAALLAYSPLHNVRKGTRYPPTLVATADTDDRVAPWHSFKFASTLQWAQEGAAPILLRTETRAGHGAATPTAERIRLEADSWAFLAKNLGMRIGD